MKYIVGLILLLVVTTQAGEEETEEVQEEVFTVEVFAPTDPPHLPVTYVPEVKLEGEGHEEEGEGHQKEGHEEEGEGHHEEDKDKPIPIPSTSPTTPPTTESTTQPTTTTTTLPPTTTTTTPTTTTTEATTTPVPTTTTTTAPPTTPSKPPSTTEKTTTTTEKTTTTSTTEPTTEIPSTTPESSSSCPKDLYCDGERLPEDVLISGRHVACDPAPAPKDHCCLPQGKHLVCYNVTVDGYHLNFASERPAMSTDYMELCEALVKSQNAIVGAYSTISMTKGGGELAYRYGEWAIVRPTRHRVKDVACMITEPTKPPKKENKQKESQEKKDKINKENDTSDQNNVITPTSKSED